ncbi:MAG: hypothetical protein R6V27_02205 [Balneolaceae bacterium]
METNTSQISIKLDDPDSIKEYDRLQSQWENEGGSTRPSSIENMIPDGILPLKPGEQFKVISGTIERTDDQLFYVVDIEKIGSTLNLEGEV